MDETLEAALKDNYPTFFDLLNDPPDDADEDTAVPTISSYGIECDDGWYRLIDAVSSQVELYFNNSPDQPTVKAVQVKEKLGGLRVYTDTDGDAEGLRYLTHLVEHLSKHTCELCGDMGSTRVRKNVGPRVKALCDEHYYEKRSIPDTLDIWQFEMDCFKCEETTSVVYPEPLGGPDGGSWSAVGPELSTKDYCSIEQIYSDTQKQFVWGNRCEHCNVYIGNYFVWSAAREQFADNWSEAPGFDRVDTLAHSL